MQPPPPPPLGVPERMSGVVAQLKDLKELLDSGALSQEEFDAQKKLILNPPGV